jgi:hypothetical protein
MGAPDPDGLKTVRYRNEPDPDGLKTVRYPNEPDPDGLKTFPTVMGEGALIVLSRDSVGDGLQTVPENGR